MDQNTGKPKGTPLSLEDTPIYKRRAMLSSVEAEKKLETAYKRLEELSEKKVANTKLEEYWPEDAPPAPFIESMTFKELKSVKISDLLDKHSFNDGKLLGIVGAIENFIVKNAKFNFLSKIKSMFSKK